MIQFDDGIWLPMSLAIARIEMTDRFITDRKEYDRILEAIKAAKVAIGMTETMSPVATIEAFAKTILLLRGDVLRLQGRAKDPSGRWG